MENIDLSATDSGQTLPATTGAPETPDTPTAAAVADWVVPGLLSTGLTMLTGEPKSGKSWLALDLALAVGHGGLALQSIPCPAADVIYFDMENGKRRLEMRIEAVIKGGAADLSRLFFAADPPPEKDIVTALMGWVADVARPRLVVIDAAQRVGPVAGGRLARRELREEELSRLQSWAVEEDVAVLVVMREQGRQGAGLERILGTADATLVLGRKAGVPVLAVKGRDTTNRKMTLAFDDGCWSILDSGDGSRREFHRAEILGVLRSSAWAMGPRHVAGEIGITVGNARRTMSRMARDGEIARYSPGRYILPKCGLNGASRVPDVLPPKLEEQWFQEHSRDAGGPRRRAGGSRMSRTSPE